MPAPSPEQWLALSPQLDEALGMTEEERASWLTSLGKQDPRMAEQLEALLERHLVLIREGFLQEPAIEFARDLGLRGQTLGAYTLISQIGLGGMSSVWLAERSDARFERKVAVKFLNIALIGKSAEERFQREGIILGRLAHPNIAELLDAGVSVAGQPYLVLEHIDGDHIDSYCDERGLGIEARIRLFIDALGAVAHAHANLIVHRDLKPPNILVRSDGQVKLLDFGIAKLLEEEEQRGGATITIDGARAMTPKYAAPEQMTGGSATTATDIYAMGIILYVLLTGWHPAEETSSAPADLVKAIVEGEPARPSDIVASARESGLLRNNAAQRGTTPERLSRQLRGDLDIIVAKALKKSPGERYESVSAFAEDLQRYLKQEPILARPDAIAYRVGKFVRRRRQSLTAALFVSLVAAGAMIASWTYSPRTQAPELKQQRLTANDDTLPVLNAAVSPDGRYLSYSDQRGIHLQLVETGEIQRLPSLAEIAPERARWTVGGWYPDSKRFIAAAAASGKPASLWAVPIHDGKPEKLGDFDGLQGAGSISPDGAHIAFASNQTAIGAHEIWLMGAGGESPHKILTAGFKAGFGMIAWSPGGDRLAFAEARPVGDDVELSIRSCDLHGANQTTIVREDALSAFTWTAQNRLLYARSTRTGAGQFGELWEVSVDQLGGRRGDARRLTDWAGFAIRNLNATANGKRVAFVRRTFHSSVYAGDLSGNGNRFANWREARKDDNTNVAISWTPDSRAIFFSSQRASTRQVYRQTLDSDLPAEPVTASLDTNFYIARPSPDETSMIFEGQPSGSRQFALYRASIAGGEPRMMYPIQSFAHFWCANKTAGFCVVGYAVAAESSLVISKFTLTDPPGKEALRIPLEPGTDGGVGLDYRWQLSPDGLHIAILKKGGNQIRVFSMNGSSRSLTLASYPDLLDLAWATDSQSLFVSAPGPEGITLLHVGPSGAVQRLWLQPGATWLWPIPSPDGRHIAFGYEHAEANVWMFSNF